MEFERIGKPPSDSTAAGAIKELCGTKVPCFDEGGGPAPNVRERVSLPEIGSLPLDVHEALNPVHRELALGADTAMLNSAEDTKQALETADVAQPYVDPAFNSPAICGQFIRDLCDLELSRFRCTGESFLGCFFVLKKDGVSLRLIFDTRIANCYFRKAPHTRPT